jgi:hypothetical protein
VDSLIAGFVGTSILTELPFAAIKRKTAARLEGEMPDGTDAYDLHCARCGKLLTSALLFRDGLYWHESCWQEGSRLLANAERIARALAPPMCIHEPNS